MYKDMFSIRCSIIRGGTNKGIFFRRNDLPIEPIMRDKVILSTVGSFEICQSDCFGDADLLINRFAIIGPPSRLDADIDYTFGQVNSTNNFINYVGNHGNLLSAVGPYAIDEGYVEAREPITTIRIHQTNTDSIIIAEVPTDGRKARVEGDFRIDGVPGTGAQIRMEWSNTVGAFSKVLLPTGRVQDTITIEDREYQVSLVDMGNPVIFIKAKSLGLSGTEDISYIENDKVLMNKIEQIRCHAAVMFGLADSVEIASEKILYYPFFSIVSAPYKYKNIFGEIVEEKDIDLVSRLLFMQHIQKEYPVSGAVCTGAASKFDGSIVNEVMRSSATDRNMLRIGHPGGIIPVEVDSIKGDGGTRITKLYISLTACRIMDGVMYIKNSAVK